MIDDVVKDLDNKQKLEEYFTLLGRLHQKHRIAPQYLDVMGPIFCQTIRPVLTAEAQWDNEVRDAWHRLFRMMSVRMKSAYSTSPNRNGTPSLHSKSTHVSPSQQSHSAQIHPHPGKAPQTTERSPGKRLFQKNNQYHQRRRVSVDEINERKIRLQAQHCHVLNPHKRGALGGSALSVVPDLHDYHLGSNGGQSRSLARSHQDLRTGLTSPLSGPSAMLFKNASEAKAKACKERRTSLHQLVFGQRTKSLEKNNQTLTHRERSRSEGLLSKYTVSHA